MKKRVLLFLMLLLLTACDNVKGVDNSSTQKEPIVQTLEGIESFTVDNNASIGSKIGKVKIPSISDDTITEVTLIGEDINKFHISNEGVIYIEQGLKEKRQLHQKFYYLKVKITYASKNITYINIVIISTQYIEIEEIDTTPPTKPILITTLPKTTTEDTQTIEIVGEVGTKVWVNNKEVGEIGSSGKTTTVLNTSGDIGVKSFTIFLRDENNNSSESLLVSIIKEEAVVVDTIRPTITLLGESSTDVTPKPLEPIFSEFNVGIGGSSAFPFSSNSGEKIWVSARNLILNDNVGENGYYQDIKEYNATAFNKLHNYVKESKFIILWFVEGWEESWYNQEEIQQLMDAGYIPVFSYWYFGDKLLDGMPDENKIALYEEDNLRVAQFLNKLNGKKMIIMEPEFNKPTVLESNATQHQFASIISNAIDIIKEDNPNLLFTLSMMDIGSRGVNETMSKCGYENCSLGDKYAWERSSIVYDDLIDKLDFISFHQMMGQFSRDYSNPGTWDEPNIRLFSDDEIGIDYLAQRVSNMSKYLYEKYNKPIFVPYIGIATATWNDLDADNTLDDNEINYYGWEDKANNFYSQLAVNRETLKENGMFGFAPMALFDNPRHDYGGYQYFMQNEYHLGIIGSSAVDEVDIASYGDLYFKGDILDYIYSSVN